MKIAVWFLGLVVFVLSNAGCSSKQNGEVSTDTGSGPKRRAGVSIQVVTEEQLIARVKQKLPQISIKTEQLNIHISQYSESLLKAAPLLGRSAGFLEVGELLDAKNRYAPSADVSLGFTAAINDGLVRNAAAAQGLLRQFELERANLEKEKDALNKLSSGFDSTYFEEKFIDALETVETDANGNFKLTKQPKKVALVATFNNLAWAIWITPDQNGKTIAMTDRNVVTTGCEECVFGGKVTPKSLTGE